VCGGLAVVQPRGRLWSALTLLPLYSSGVGTVGSTLKLFWLMTWASAGRAARLSWGEAMTEPKKAAVAARERMDAMAGTGREGWTDAAERAVRVQRSRHQGQGSGDAEYLKAGAVRGPSGRGAAAKVHRASAMYKTR
jgi:hypothetical protein